MRSGLLIIVLLAIVWGSGCNIINPDEQIPTYVHVDSFKFIDDRPGLTGSVSHDIKSVWAFFDGQTVGVFDLPANIPVLAGKEGELKLAPGIDNQGLTTYQELYPFYTIYTTSLSPEPGKVVTLVPETKYVTDIKAFKEDFESQGMSLVKLSGDTSFIRVTDQDKVFEGGGAAYLQLNTSMPNSESIMAIGTKPVDNAFLEFNYKANVDFTVGIYVFGVNTSSYLAGVTGKGDGWKKFYVNIYNYIKQYPNATNLGILIKSSLPEGQTDGYVLLDNIKVISF